MQNSACLDLQKQSMILVVLVVLDNLVVLDIINIIMHLDDDVIFEKYDMEQRFQKGRNLVMGILNNHLERAFLHGKGDPQDNVDYDKILEDLEEKILFKKLMTLPEIYKEINLWNTELPESEYSEEFVPVDLDRLHDAILKRQGAQKDPEEPVDDEGVLMAHMKDLGMIPSSAGVTLSPHTTLENIQNTDS